MKNVTSLPFTLATCSLVVAAGCGGNHSLLTAPEDGADASVDATSQGGNAGHGGYAGAGGNGGSAAAAGAGGAAGQGGTGGSAGKGGAAIGGSAGASGTGGAPDAGPCADGCSDGIPCTVDTCVQGACVHAPGSCPVGQYCDLGAGCLKAPICSSVSQCLAQWESDGCKTNIQCDGATATCKFELLDKDHDLHPPIVCGGDDCDDTDDQRYLGLTETCDGKDNNCNGTVDESCVCPPSKPTSCNGTCVDTTTDNNHCGTCGNHCDLGSCKAGVCPTCLPGGMMLALDQSGSMTGTKSSSMGTAVTAFVQEPASAGVSLGVIFYPRLSSDIALCLASDYASPDVNIGALPLNATNVLSAFAGKSAFGNSVFSPVLESAVANVRSWMTLNPNRAGAVVMIHDGGMGNGCTSDTVNWATSAASAGLTGSPSVVTHVIGLGALTSQEVQDMSNVASSGGGAFHQVANVASQPILDALHTIRATLLCP